MKIQMTITIDLGDKAIDEKNGKEIEWSYNEIIKAKNKLFLYRDIIGNKLGKIIKIENMTKIK